MHYTWTFHKLSVNYGITDTLRIKQIMQIQASTGLLQAGGIGNPYRITCRSLTSYALPHILIKIGEKKRDPTGSLFYCRFPSITLVIDIINNLGH